MEALKSLKKLRVLLCRDCLSAKKDSGTHGWCRKKKKKIALNERACPDIPGVRKERL